jgi:xylitol oxidase
VRNWAGNITYGAQAIHRPQTVDQLRRVVAGNEKVRALGTRHSFNDLADSPGVLVSTTELPRTVSIDSSAQTAQVAAGLRYAEIAEHIDSAGFALPNLGSLPHVSVAGACATATHGSSVRTGGLATSVRALDMVTADGDVVTIDRDDDDFAGAVVNLGALGVVVNVTLDLVPSFDTRLRVYENLPLDVVDEHFTELVSCAYSVCLFTDWETPGFTQVWINDRTDEPECTVTGEPWFTAVEADEPLHPIRSMSARSCTQQQGVPGRWYERLPHFRPEFTPSAGEELQSEYMIAHQDTPSALHAIDRIREHIAPVLQIGEIRTIAADNLWLSPCYGRGSVSIHFTWIDDLEAVLPVAAMVEDALADFGCVPHWAKIFAMGPERLGSCYPRLADFRRLAGEHDPSGKFSNRFLDHYLSGATVSSSA